MPKKLHHHIAALLEVKEYTTIYLPAIFQDDWRSHVRGAHANNFVHAPGHSIHHVSDIDIDVFLEARGGASTSGAKQATRDVER